MEVVLHVAVVGVPVELAILLDKDGFSQELLNLGIGRVDPELPGPFLEDEAIDEEPGAIRVSAGNSVRWGGQFEEV